MKTMKIAVLDHNSKSISVIDVSKDILNGYDDVEDYLETHCGFDLNEIDWIGDENLAIKTNLTDSSFSCDKDIKGCPKWFANSVINFKDRVKLLDISPWVKIKDGFHSRDEILVTNRNIFGDNREHGLDMVFYDGFAIENGCEKRMTPLFLLYPSEKNVWTDENMTEEVKDFCGSDLITPFEIALKYGKLFTYSETKQITSNYE